jgi:hypothetical protein
MSAIIAELKDAENIEEVQNRMLRFTTDYFPDKDKIHLWEALKKFSNKIKAFPIVWTAKHCTSLIEYSLENYHETGRLSNLPEECVKIVKSYLLTCQVQNKVDRKSYARISKTIAYGDEFAFEKSVWPFAIKDFEFNRKTNPLLQIFLLHCLSKACSFDNDLEKAWNSFMKYNNFSTTEEFFNTILFLTNTSVKPRVNNPYLRAFFYLQTKDIPRYFLNLSFDKMEYDNDPSNRIAHKGIKSRPLFKAPGNEFFFFNPDYLYNKIYIGTMFDLFYKTEISKSSRFKTFSDFKSTISSKIVEALAFRTILRHLLQNEYCLLHFDDKGNDGYPDCYIRRGNRIFLIEFKDYIFPGKTTEGYSFENIKAHIDTKFIESDRKSPKGITQVKQQIQKIANDGFDFDQFEDEEITIWPIIVHTDFIYQLPGINTYLQKHFIRSLNTLTVKRNLTIKVEPLALIDIETVFDWLRLKDFTLSTLEKFLIDYVGEIRFQERKYVQSRNLDDYLRSRAGFDEVYNSVFKATNVYKMEPKDYTDLIMRLNNES